MVYLALPSVLSVIAGVISAFAGWYFFSSSRKSGNIGVRDLGLVFWSLAGHAFILGFSSIFFLDHPVILAWSYRLAIFFVFLSLVAGVGIPVFRSYPLFGRHLKVLRLAIFILALVILAVQTAFNGVPETANNMVVDWNDSVWAGAIVGSILMIYCLTWAYLFWRDSYLVRPGVLRLKMRILAADGAILGLAAIFSFTVFREYFFDNLAAYLFIGAVAITSVIAFLPKTSSSFEGSGASEVKITNID